MERLVQSRPARMPELEAVRTISFGAVVLQHILGAYVRRQGVSAAEGAALALLFGLCKFAVPAFVFVSGAVLFRNYFGRLQYGAFLKKRLGSIVLPYLLWAAFYYVYSWLARGVPPYGKREFLVRVLTCNVSYHTWYVLLVLQFYLLLPLIFALMRGLIRLGRTRAGFAAAVTAVTIGYALLISFPQLWQPIPVLGRLMYEQRTRNVLYYLVYFLLGGLLGLYPEKFQSFVRRFTPLLAAAAVLGYGYCEYYLFHHGYETGLPNFNWMGSLNVHMFLFSAVSVLLLYRGCLAGGGGRLCAFVGKHSYSAYLAHVMVLSTGSALLLRTGLGYPAFYLLLTAGTLVISVAVGWGFDWVYGGLRRVKNGS